jgi:hypothetical protein
MTAINMALYGLRGFAIHGNSLTFEPQKVYRIGFNGSGFIEEVKLEDVPEEAREKITDAGEQLSLLDAA